MDHTTEVEVGEARGDIAQLTAGLLIVGHSQ